MTHTATQPQEEMHGEPIIIIRPSFKKICGFMLPAKDGKKPAVDSACRAAILNHVLYWIAKKRKHGVDYWYSTGDGLYHDLDESWGVTVVRREVNALIDFGLIGEMKNPHMGIDRTKHFIFKAEQAAIFFAKCAAEKVCHFCIGLAKHLIELLNAHLIELLNVQPDDEAFDRTVKCLCPKHQGHLIDLSKHLIELSKPFDRFIKAITQVSTQDYDSGEVSGNPNESTSEDFSSSLEDEVATRYKKGHAAIMVSGEGFSMPITFEAIEEAATRLLAPAVTDLQEQKLYTSSPHVDSHTEQYHIAPLPTASPVTTSLSAIGDDHGTAQSTMAATQSALQADPGHTKTTPEHTTMAGETPAPSKRKRKPRAPTIDAEMAAKVAKIFDGFDRLLQEVTHDPEACYAREKTAQAAIIDELLPCKPTWERLHRVFMELWNKPRNAKDNFYWREHMTIKAICHNYQTTWLGLQAKEHPSTETAPPVIVRDASKVKNFNGAGLQPRRNATQGAFA